MYFNLLSYSTLESTKMVVKLANCYIDFVDLSRNFRIELFKVSYTSCICAYTIIFMHINMKLVFDNRQSQYFLASWKTHWYLCIYFTVLLASARLLLCLKNVLYQRFVYKCVFLADKSGLRKIIYTSVYVLYWLTWINHSSNLFCTNQIILQTTTTHYRVFLSVNHYYLFRFSTFNDWIFLFFKYFSHKNMLCRNILLKMPYTS